jgi:hypothetical protein
VKPVRGGIEPECAQLFRSLRLAEPIESPAI